LNNVLEVTKYNIYITSSQNTTKFICTMLYNILHNYMFRPFLGHLQVVFT